MSGHGKKAGTMNNHTGAIDGSLNKKRRSNVGKACENCRRRRVKCDGIQPCCGTCKVYKDECSWDPREDYRKPLSRQQVQALEARVADLERLLREHGLDPGHAAGPSRTEPEEIRDWRNGIKDEEGSSTGSGDVRDWSQDHLVEGEPGDYQVYGPTSAFRHLGKYHHDGEVRSLLPQGSSPESPSSRPFGFRRYLPQEVYLTQVQHDTALDRFFRYYASWAQRTHPTLFVEDMHTALDSETLMKSHHYSPMLHNAILAIGLCFSDELHLRTPAVRKVFAKEAKTHFEEEGMNPTVATVQALAHLASYHSLSAEHNLGWLYIGMALRCAMALGLNMDNTKMLRNGNVTAVQARERNVTYWTTFIQEGLWAPYIGRPVHWPEHTAPPPTVDDQLDSLLWRPHEIPGRVVEPSLKTQPGMISSTFVETVKLMEIGARIMNTLYGIKADMATLIRSGVISEISLALSTWLERLPQALSINHHSAKNALPHILMMHLSWAWLVILLHRPFYRPLARLPTNAATNHTAGGYDAALAVKHCDRAAIQIVTLLQTWHRLHDLRFTPPTALQCCFIAGTTHLLSFASSRTAKKQADALSLAQECIRLMSCMAVSWPAAQQKQNLLEDLLAEYGMTVTSGRTLAGTRPPTHPSGAGGGPLSHQPPQFHTPLANVPLATGVIPNPEQRLYSPPQVSSYADPVTAMQQMSMSSNGINMNQDNEATPFCSFDMLARQADQVGMGENPSYNTNQYPPVDDFELQFGNFNFGLPSLDMQQLEADWEPNNFVFSEPSFNTETQALFDYIIQPHLDVGMHHQPQFNQPP